MFKAWPTAFHQRRSAPSRSNGSGCRCTPKREINGRSFPIAGGGKRMGKLAAATEAAKQFLLVMDTSRAARSPKKNG